MSDKTLCKLCPFCEGAGTVPTGIEEAPEASCRRCDGEGHIYEPAPSPAMNAASQPDDQGSAQFLFDGDDAALCESIHALLALDKSGSLVPHGIGGHARTLLATAALRLAAPVGQGSASQPDPAICEGCNGHGMVGNILDSDTCPFCRGSGETTAMAGSGPDGYEVAVNCAPCGGTGAADQGSATSGEAAGGEREKFDAAMRALYGDDITKDDLDANWSETNGFNWRRSRAALAAKAEQANTPVPRGYKLVPLEPTDHMTFVGQSLRCNAVNSIGAIYREMIAAAPSAEQSNTAGAARQGGNTKPTIAEWNAMPYAKHGPVAAPVAERAAPSESIKNDAEFKRLLNECVQYDDYEAEGEFAALAAYIDKWRKSLATPAPTAGESSARPDGQCLPPFAEPASERGASDVAYGPVYVVRDLVRNLLTLDQSAPIYSAFHVDYQGERRCRTRPVWTSWERVIDGKWIDPARKDVPYAVIVWAKPEADDQSSTAGAAKGGMHEDDTPISMSTYGSLAECEAEQARRDLCATQGRKEGKA